MPILEQIRPAARKLLGPTVAKYVRRCFRKTLPAAALYSAQLRGKRGLEVGGPSELFCDEGALPIYRDLQRLDNCLYSARTLWTSEVRRGGEFAYHPRKQSGTQFICEASDLRDIADASYECVLASHCLEHVANPLRALSEWTRVLSRDGLLLLVLPHKDGTFDWRRPTTPLTHMIEDFKNNVTENDQTHVAEILSLHDLTRDRAAGSPEQFKQRCSENSVQRAMHHHVFDTPSAVALVHYAGLQIVRVDNLKPHHIFILARRCAGGPDNTPFLDQKAEYLRATPFPSDHRMNGTESQVSRSRAGTGK